MRSTNRRPSVFADKVSCSFVGIYSLYHNGWSWTLLGYSRQLNLETGVSVCSYKCVDAEVTLSIIFYSSPPFLTFFRQGLSPGAHQIWHDWPWYPLAFLPSPGIIGQSSQNWPFYLNARNRKSGHPCSSTTELLETLLRLERWLSS